MAESAPTPITNICYSTVWAAKPSCCAGPSFSVAETAAKAVYKAHEAWCATTDIHWFVADSRCRLSGVGVLDMIAGRVAGGETVEFRPTGAVDCARRWNSPRSPPVDWWPTQTSSPSSLRPWS
jgi:hypothetical protein